MRLVAASDEKHPDREEFLRLLRLSHSARHHEHEGERSGDHQRCEDEERRCVEQEQHGEALGVGRGRDQAGRLAERRELQTAPLRNVDDLLAVELVRIEPVAAVVFEDAVLDLSCDLAVAAQEARFALPGVNIGVFCSTPAVGVGRNNLIA